MHKSDFDKPEFVAKIVQSLNEPTQKNSLGECLAGFPYRPCPGTCPNCQTKTLERTVPFLGGTYSGSVRCTGCNYGASLMQHLGRAMFQVEQLPESPKISYTKENMPGPRKIITDHHQHRADLADEATSKIEDGCWNIQQIIDDLEETGNNTSEWEEQLKQIRESLDKVRKLAR